MEADIRLATLADIPAIRRIVDAAYGRYIPRIGRKPGPMLTDYAKLIAGGRGYVAVRAGVSLGILILIPQEEVMLLDNVAVAPQAQGLGIGRLLLRFAEEVASEAGHRAIRLYTNVAMTENISLYQRIGYVETYRAEESGLRRVYMCKPLATELPQSGDKRSHKGAAD